MAAGKLPDGEGRGWAHNRRNDRRQAASVRELRMEDRVIFVEPFAELIGNDFEAGAQPTGVEGDGRFAAEYPVAFVPPGGIGIAHDLADALVEQERLNGPEKRKDQLVTQSGNLTQWKPSFSRASATEKRTGLCSLVLRVKFIVCLLFRAGFLSAVKLQDGRGANFPNPVLHIPVLLVGKLAADQLAIHGQMRALLDLLSELDQLAPYNHAVPFGAVDIFAAVLVLVRGLRCNRQHGVCLLVVGGAGFGILTCESDE